MNVAFCAYGIQLRQIIDMFPASNPSFPVSPNLLAVKITAVLGVVVQLNGMIRYLVSNGRAIG